MYMKRSRLLGSWYKFGFISVLETTMNTMFYIHSHIIWEKEACISWKAKSDTLVHIMC